MNKTEECINVLQQEIAGIAEHAFYATYRSQKQNTEFADFMKELTLQIEHVACGYLLKSVFTNQTEQGVTDKQSGEDVQRLINLEKESV